MKRSLTVLTLLVLLMAIAPAALGQNITGQATWNFTGIVAEGGTWEMRVTASSKEIDPGDGLTLAIDYEINSYGLAYNADRIDGVYSLVTGARVFNQDGEMIGGPQVMASTLLTGTGLPIEIETSGLPTDGFGGKFHHPIDSYRFTPSSDLIIDTDEGTIHGTELHTIIIDPEIPIGWYQLRIDIGLQINEGDIVTLMGVDPSLSSTSEEEQTHAVTGPIAIGTQNQPQMIWTLFSSSLPSGGVVAVEDRGYLATTNRTGWSSRAILPMTDTRGGQIRYLLEPDFPQVWNPFMRTPGSLLDLDYNSGWLQVRIENPDGSIVDLGGAPFSGRRGIGATTLQDKFAYNFTSYGRHRIELTGWIQDKSGQTYVGGGVYEVYVAHLIDIETNVLNGTPFRKNDFFDSGFQLYPPVPAKVEITWEIDPNSRIDPDDGSFTAYANKWGYYSPPLSFGRDRFARESSFQFNSPGEYRVVLLASYSEPDGTLWMGEKTIIGVIHPDDSIDLASRPPSSGSFSFTNNARFVPVPADSGDTVILPESTTPGLPTVYTFPIGFFTGDQTGFRTDDSALMELESGAAGTFVTPCLASSSGLFPVNYPEDIDRRSYLVSLATRSDGYCQGFIGEGSSNAHLPYPTFPWNPVELSADASGDIYHFWSSMVYRDITANSTRYGYYSTGVVLSKNVTVPALHQAGSSIISDGWGSHNLIVHNTAVRPGSIISEGSTFTPAAYFLPLPPESTVEFIVTPPEGEPEIITLTADNSGYASGMRERFNLDQEGVWKVESTLTQDAETGTLLGINDGAPWEFYVISGGNDQPVDFHLPFRMPLDPDSEVLLLNGDLLGSELTEGIVNVSTTFNGAVVEQTTRRIQDGAFVYTIDLDQISNSFENFDLYDSRDRLVLSFFAIGLTSSGSKRMAARMIYIQGGILYTGEKDYSPIDPSTREDRLQDIATQAETDRAHEIRGRIPPW